MGDIQSKTAAVLRTRSVPKYMRVRNQLHDEIRSGKLAPVIHCQRKPS